MDKQIERYASFCMFYDVRGNISPHPPPLPKHLTFSLMLGFCARKQIGYNSAHPRLYVDTKETMSRGGCYENVFLGTFHKMAHGLYRVERGCQVPHEVFLSAMSRKYSPP